MTILTKILLFPLLNKTKVNNNSKFFQVKNHKKSVITILSGSLSKSGPLHFWSEESFPSNFSQ